MKRHNLKIGIEVITWRAARAKRRGGGGGSGSGRPLINSPFRDCTNNILGKPLSEVNNGMESPRYLLAASPLESASN